jgi:hypothetical protein
VLTLEGSEALVMAVLEDSRPSKLKAFNGQERMLEIRNAGWNLRCYYSFDKILFAFEDQNKTS